MKTKSFNLQPDGTLTFTLTIPQVEVNSAYQAVLREAQKTAELKGFRRGHAPLNLVEASSDPIKLLNHTLKHIFPPVYSQFITTNHLAPLIEPQITPKALKMDADWVFDVKVATNPTFELGAYKKVVKKALSDYAKAHKSDDKNKKDKSDHSDHLESVVFDALLDSVKLTVSPLLIDAETKSALNRLATQLSQLKISVADYAKSIKKTNEELVAEYKKSAEVNLKIHFILYAIQSEQKLSDHKTTLDFLLKL